MENKIADNNKRHICPDCGKSFKHLITHLKSKHAWKVEDVFDFKEKEKNSLTVMSTDAASDAIEEAQYSARKISEFEVEEEQANVIARGAIDKLILINTLSEMKAVIGSVYRNVENKMSIISSNVATSVRHSGYDEVDGPTRDWTRCVRKTLEGSCEHVCAILTYEMFRLDGELKNIL